METCPTCNQTLEIGDWPWCPHGQGSPTVLGDDGYIGGKVLRNVAHDNITVYSRSEEQRVLKAHGVEPFVRHVGKQGSDKNPGVTDKWV